MNTLHRSTVSILLCTLINGCKGDEPCNPNVAEDEPIEVDVVGRAALDPYTPSFLAGLPSCAIDDVEVGSHYQITLSKHVPFNQGGSVCYSFECPLDFPGPATSLDNSAGNYGLSYVCTNTNAKVRLGADCEMGRYVGLYTRGGATQLYAEGGAAAPTHRLIRGLTRTSGGAVCSDLTTRFPDAASRDLVCADEFEVTFRKP